MSNPSKKYDPYTLGNSPAAIYLIDLLNNSTNKIEHNILSHINSYKVKFKQIVQAFEAGILSDHVVLSFISGQTLELDIKAKQWADKGYNILIINLAKNLVIANYSQFRRQQFKINKIKSSATQRAKNILKNEDKKYAHQEVSTYGREGDDKTLNVIVKFNEYGLPNVQLDTSMIEDHITNEHLMKKSLNRLDRLGKPTDLYKDLQK